MKSIPAHIAEGPRREYTIEFLHHLSIPRGSLMEMETHPLLNQRAGLSKQEQLDDLLNQTDWISRMIRGLRKALLSIV